MSSIRALVALVSVALVTVAVPGTSGAAPAVAKPCKSTAQGTLWTYQSQTGVAYSIVGVNGASCPLAVSWLPRLAKAKSTVVKGPKGWRCVSHRPAGACTSKTGAVFTWAPKLRAR